MEEGLPGPGSSGECARLRTGEPPPDGQSERVEELGPGPVGRGQPLEPRQEPCQLGPLSARGIQPAAVGDVRVRERLFVQQRDEAGKRGSELLVSLEGVPVHGQPGPVPADQELQEVEGKRRADLGSSDAGGLRLVEERQVPRAGEPPDEAGDPAEKRE